MTPRRSATTPSTASRNTSIASRSRCADALLARRRRRHGDSLSLHRLRVDGLVPHPVEALDHLAAHSRAGLGHLDRGQRPHLPADAARESLPRARRANDLRRGIHHSLPRAHHLSGGPHAQHAVHDHGHPDRGESRRLWSRDREAQARAFIPAADPCSARDAGAWRLRR